MKNQTSENRRECIREASKIVHEGNVHLEIFSPLLRTDIVQKTVVWCPWLGTGQFQWSIGTNGTIGTNGKAPYSNGCIGEYASH